MKDEKESYETLHIKRYSCSNCLVSEWSTSVLCVKTMRIVWCSIAVRSHVYVLQDGNIRKWRHFAYEALHKKRERVALTHTLFCRKEATFRLWGFAQKKREYKIYPLSSVGKRRHFAYEVSQKKREYKIYPLFLSERGDISLMRLCTKKGASFWHTLFSVGKRRLERPTPTSRT